MKKIILLLLIILFSCKDYGNPLSPDSSNSYSDIQDIFDINCTGCHDIDGFGGLNLLSYDDVINSETVIPNDASSSSLYDRITREESAQGDMPPSGRLTDEQIILIQMWINQGALTEW